MKTLWILPFLLIFSSAFAQSPELDSIRRALDAQPRDSATLDGYAMYINQQIYYNAEAAKKTAAEFEEEFAKESTPPALRGKFNTIAGMAYANTGSLDSALVYFQKGKKIFEEEKDDFGLGVVLGAVRAIQSDKGDYEGATKSAIQYLELTERSGDSLDIARATFMYSQTLYEQNKYEKAESYLQRAEGILLRHLSKLPDNTPEQRTTLDLLHQTVRYLSRIALQKDNVEKALHLSERVVAYAEQLNNPAIISNALGLRGDVLYKRKEYAEALRNYEEAQTFAKQSGNSIEARHGRNMAQIYLETDRPARALELLYADIEYTVRRSGRMPANEDFYRNLARAHDMLGNRDSTVFYYKALTALMDSTYTAQLSAKTEELQTRYETEKKEARIAEQESLLASQQKTQRLTRGILALVGLLAAVLFFFLQRQNRLRKELAVKNTEKEYLMKEIHHRVKNNLQILSSLLNLQKDYIVDPVAVDAVTDGRNRVQSMGLIHQKLYTEDSLGKVDMRSYIPDLCLHLSDTFDGEERVKNEYDIRVEKLDVEFGIPLGLILNELVTNAYKYAFPDDRSGVIKISLYENANSKLCLEVADNGVGKSAALQSAHSTSFGTDLVHILAKKLKAEITTKDENGHLVLLCCERYER